MKRDKDFLKELLVELEASKLGWVNVSISLNPSEEDLKRLHHFKLLEDEALVAKNGKSGYRLTPLGHDAAELVGKSEFWKAVKEKSPSEAYEFAKGMTSTLTLTALSKLLGLG